MSFRDETYNAESNCNRHRPSSRLSKRLGSKISRLEIPERGDVCAIFGDEEHEAESSCDFQTPDSFSENEGYETAEESFIDEEEFMVVKSNLFGSENNRSVPKEKILKRIDSHKGMKSYQLAKQLSCKWTTGVGPRIGCMRDYPSELQCRILEEQNLSPRALSASPRISSLSRAVSASPRNFSLSRFTNQRLS